MGPNSMVFVWAIPLILFSSQIACSEDVNTLDNSDSVDRLIGELQEIVDRAVATSTSQTESISRNLAEIQRNLFNEARDQIQNSTEKYLRQFLSLGLLADALGKPQCLTARAAELEAVSESLIQDVEDCLQHIGTEASGVMANIEEYIGAAQRSVGIYRDKKSQCEEGVNSQCWVMLIKDLQMAKQYVPRQVLDETVRMMVLSKDWEKALQTCFDDRVGLIYSEAENIVRDIEDCLMSPSSTLF